MKRRDFVTVLGGAAVAWPLAARAQQKPMPVIGFLSAASPRTGTSFLAAFRLGLSDAGFVEGQSVAIEFRYAEGQYDRLPALAADLVSRKVDVIASAGGPPAVRAARDATSTIPIVFLSGTDPVAAGLVATLARPGGNLTGVSLQFGELTPKRLELLTELVPRARVIALLVNPTNANAERLSGDLEEATRAKGVQLPILKASSESEIDAAFTNLVNRHADAMIIGGDPFFDGRREQLVALAAHHSVPAIYARLSTAEPKPASGAE